jgi:hypothetical protein
MFFYEITSVFASISPKKFYYIWARVQESNITNTLVYLSEKLQFTSVKTFLQVVKSVSPLNHFYFHKIQIKLK